MRYELVLQREEGHILSYHGPKITKFLMTFFLVFQSSSFKTKKNFKLLGFFETNGPIGAKPPKSLQILLQILRPVSNTEILTPGLVGNKIEMVA